MWFQIDAVGLTSSSAAATTSTATATQTTTSLVLASSSGSVYFNLAPNSFQFLLPSKLLSLPLREFM